MFSVPQCLGKYACLILSSIKHEVALYAKKATNVYNLSKNYITIKL